MFYLLAILFMFFTDQRYHGGIKTERYTSETERYTSETVWNRVHHLSVPNYDYSLLLIIINLLWIFIISSPHSNDVFIIMKLYFILHFLWYLLIVIIFLFQVCLVLSGHWGTGCLNNHGRAWYKTGSMNMPFLAWMFLLVKFWGNHTLWLV